MRPRPSVVIAALFVLAAVHAWWGVKILLASNVLMGGSQLMSAGALVFAAVGASHRRTFAIGMGIAAAATALRLLVTMADGFGPFSAATTGLTFGMALAAWSAHRLDEGRAGFEGATLRAGFVAMGLAYLAFLALGFMNGGSVGTGTFDLALRAAAAFAIAVFIDAPPVRTMRRNGFAADASSAPR